MGVAVGAGPDGGGGGCPSGGGGGGASEGGGGGASPLGGGGGCPAPYAWEICVKACVEVQERRTA